MSIKFAPMKIDLFKDRDDLKTYADKLKPVKSLIPSPEHQVRNRPGRNPDHNAKQLLTLRLDPDVIAHFRSTGDGWQTRMNDALRKATGL